MSSENHLVALIVKIGAFAYLLQIIQGIFLLRNVTWYSRHLALSPTRRIVDSLVDRVGGCDRPPMKSQSRFSVQQSSIIGKQVRLGLGVPFGLPPMISRATLFRRPPQVLRPRPEPRNCPRSLRLFRIRGKIDVEIDQRQHVCSPLEKPHRSSWGLILLPKRDRTTLKAGGIVTAKMKDWKSSKPETIDELGENGQFV